MHDTAIIINNPLRFFQAYVIVSHSSHFFYWAITMIAISSALIIAATQPDPHVYDEPVDIFRGLCEGLAILLITAAAINEIYNLCLYVHLFFS